MKLEDAIEQFRLNYKGNKIAFLIVGGGYSCLDFRRYPGASAFYHTAYEPYANEEIVTFLVRNIKDYPAVEDISSLKFCSKEMTENIYKAFSNYITEPNITKVVVNSALTTNNYRRGINRSYIVIEDKKYYLTLNKLNEETHNNISKVSRRLIDKVRYKEDEKIGQIVLSLLLNDSSIMPSLLEGESLVDA